MSLGKENTTLMYSALMDTTSMKCSAERRKRSSLNVHVLNLSFIRRHVSIS